MTRPKFARNTRRGMAMATVIFAMAVVMLLSTIVTANALRTRSAVLVAESGFKQRNNLNAVGEYFVADVKQSGTKYSTATNVNETANGIAQALTNTFDSLAYKYAVEASVADGANGDVTVFRLGVYTLDGGADEAADNLSLRKYKMYVSVRQTVDVDGNTAYALTEWTYCR